MKKLIELLNEYEKEKNDLKFIPKFWEIYQEHLSFLEYNSKYSELLCISKRYEFIKRLVKNDKIDRHNVNETKYGWEFNYYWTIPNSKKSIEVQEERLLMLLAIQDNPIEFLVSILK